MRNDRWVVQEEGFFSIGPDEFQHLFPGILAKQNPAGPSDGWQEQLQADVIRELAQGDTHYPMVGALPIWVEQMRSPQGHGYVEAKVDSENLFLEEGTSFCGHEFHYSRLESIGDEVKTVLSLQRGVGIGKGRDGIHSDGVVASYTHLHALGMPKWAPALVTAASGGGR